MSAYSYKNLKDSVAVDSIFEFEGSQDEFADVLDDISHMVAYDVEGVPSFYIQMGDSAKADRQLIEASPVSITMALGRRHEDNFTGIGFEMCNSAHVVNSVTRTLINQAGNTERSILDYLDAIVSNMQNEPEVSEHEKMVLGMIESIINLTGKTDADIIAEQKTMKHDELDVLTEELDEEI